MPLAALIAPATEVEAPACSPLPVEAAALPADSDFTRQIADFLAAFAVLAGLEPDRVTERATARALEPVTAGPAPVAPLPAHPSAQRRRPAPHAVHAAAEHCRIAAAKLRLAAAGAGTNSSTTARAGRGSSGACHSVACLVALPTEPLTTPLPLPTLPLPDSAVYCRYLCHGSVAAKTRLLGPLLHRRQRSRPRHGPHRSPPVERPPLPLRVDPARRSAPLSSPPSLLSRGLAIARKALNTRVLLLPDTSD